MAEKRGREELQAAGEAEELMLKTHASETDSCLPFAKLPPVGKAQCHRGIAHLNRRRPHTRGNAGRGLRQIEANEGCNGIKEDRIV